MLLECFHALGMLSLTNKEKESDHRETTIFLTVYYSSSFGRCVASLALRWWNCTCVVKCKGEELRRKRERRRKDRKSFFSFFLFSLPSHFLSFTFFLLLISPCMYNATTAVPKKLHSVQKIEINKQKGEYWFPCGQTAIIFMNFDVEINRLMSKSLLFPCTL